MSSLAGMLYHDGLVYAYLHTISKMSTTREQT